MSYEIKKLLTTLGALLAKDMPPGWGFTLLLFSYGEAGDLFYLSSEEDMIKTMQEFIDRKK